MTCPICNRYGVTAGHILGHSKSAAKAKASAANGRKGGRPKKLHQDAVVEVNRASAKTWRVITTSSDIELVCKNPPKVGDILDFKKW